MMLIARTTLSKFSSGSPMPIITTLVSLRCWCGTLPRCRAATQTWPMISAVDRLRLKPWVAVEQNWQFSAQPTCEDTHSVPRPLSGMNTVSMALLRYPCRAATCGCRRRRPCRAPPAAHARLAVLLELGAQRLAEVGHVAEIGDVAVVDPLHHLVRAEALLAERLPRRSARGRRDRGRSRLDRVGRSRRRGSRTPASPMSGSMSMRSITLSSPTQRGQTFGGGEEVGDFDRRVLQRVRTVHGVGVDAMSAKSARMVPGAASFGLVAPIRSRLLEHGVLAFQHLDHHRAGDHELDQRVEERTLAVHGVETFGFLARQVLHLGGDDLQAGLLEAGIDLADDVLGDGVGLDDRNGALQRHWDTPVRRAANRQFASPKITEKPAYWRGFGRYG